MSKVKTSRSLSVTEGFSSTPVKNHGDHASKGLEEDVVSDDEDTFSLLSPIYHDSFDSEDEELDLLTQQTSSRQSNESLEKCGLPKTNLLKIPAELAASSLGPWQTWLLNKAKVDRLKREEKAEEERLLKETMERQEKEKRKKKMAMEEKIQEWLQIKREQEKRQQAARQREEDEEMQKQQAKQRGIEQKSQQNYKDWLQKKNNEKLERETREKEEAALKEEQEKERHRMAEIKFKEWLVKAKEKSKTTSKSLCHPETPYHKAYTAPSFYNPIPWKPIHIPPPEASPNQASTRNSQKQKNRSQALRLYLDRETLTSTHFLQKR